MKGHLTMASTRQIRDRLCRARGDPGDWAKSQVKVGGKRPLIPGYISTRKKSVNRRFYWGFGIEEASWVVRTLL
jgi:hypothetical protein